MGIKTAHAGKFTSHEEHSQAIHQMQQQALERGSQQIVTVGSDNNCDFRTGDSKIQDAIDSGAEEIRIVTDTYMESLKIIDRSVILKGGYVDCADAENNISDNQRVNIDASLSFEPVIEIFGDSQRNTVQIFNIQLTKGTGSESSQGGGISAHAADLYLYLNNVWVYDNKSFNGGGIALRPPGNIDMYAVDTVILANNSIRGGGLYCRGDNMSVLLDSGNGFSTLTSNKAEETASAPYGDGGGVLLEDGCYMTLYHGGGFNSGTQGLFNNTASAEGGGAAVKSGSTLNLIGYLSCSFVFPTGYVCRGDKEKPVSIVKNTAGENGGGIYASGTNTVVNANTLLLTYNNAAENGGGFAIEDGATLNTQYSYSRCWNPDSCNLFQNNKANGFGGAIFSKNGIVDIQHTYMQKNRANSGVVLYARGTDASAKISGSIMTDNGDFGNDGFNDNNLIVINGLTGGFDTNLTVAFSTIADNKLDQRVIANVGADVNILSTIIHETNSVDVYYSVNPESTNFNCVIAHEDASIPSGTQVNVDDPEFIDRANGNYHINPATSPALDYCNDLSLPDNKDIDLENRGWDDPMVGNNAGPFDIGADETYGNDIIFKDNFSD